VARIAFGDCSAAAILREWLFQIMRGCKPNAQLSFADALNIISFKHMACGDVRCTVLAW
jgi:hypothetical protein